MTDLILDQLEQNIRLFNLWAGTNYEVEYNTRNFVPVLHFINNQGGKYEFVSVEPTEEGLAHWWSTQLAKYGQYIDREVFIISERPWLDALVDALLTGMYVTATVQHRGKDAVGRYEAFQRLREVY